MARIGSFTQPSGFYQVDLSSIHPSDNNMNVAAPTSGLPPVTQPVNPATTGAVSGAVIGAILGGSGGAQAGGGIGAAIGGLLGGGTSGKPLAKPPTAAPPTTAPKPQVVPDASVKSDWLSGLSGTLSKLFR